MKTRTTKTRRVAPPLLAVATVLLAGQGCGSCGQQYMGAIAGPMNDPANHSLRRSILAYGLKEFCHEVLSRDAPLAMADGDPVTGRFYPDRCAQREGPDGDLVVDLGGRGYAWTNVSKKIVFTTTATVEYDQDFLMDGSTMYAYFRTKNVVASAFHIERMEAPAATLINAVMPMGDAFGQKLLADKLKAGFTVIRDSDGGADFSTGLVPKGSRPKRVLEIASAAGAVRYENARAEIHQNERDFVGPIEVTGTGKALYLTVNVDGAEGVDVLVTSGATGRASLDLYLGYPASGPLAGAPSFQETVRTGIGWTRTVPVPPGLYYVILDNTPTAGSFSPPTNTFDDRAASVRYSVQVGREP